MPQQRYWDPAELRVVPPAGLAWLAESERGQAWLSGLPEIVERCRTRWSLRLGQPYQSAYVSLTLPVWRADGTDAVLKIIFPDRETEHEGRALARWDGDGAVQLLDSAEADNAILIERCTPGTPLSEIGQEPSLRVLAELLPRLWKPAAAPFRTLTEEAAWWASELHPRWEAAGRPIDSYLVDAAFDALVSLPSTQGKQVLLHQDLHGDNVLSAQREPWLVIDPKPLLGEAEFGLAPIIRSFEFGHTCTAVLRRLDYLTGELGLDRERARWWCLGQTIAWSFGSRYLDRHVATAKWLLARQ